MSRILCKSYLQHTEDLGFKFAEMTVCICHFQKRYLKRLFKLHESRIIKLYQKHNTVYHWQQKKYSVSAYREHDIKVRIRSENGGGWKTGRQTEVVATDEWVWHTDKPCKTQSSLLPSLAWPILTVKEAPPHNQRHMEQDNTLPKREIT